MNKEWLFGIALVLCSALAVYLGFYLCLVKGIVQIAEALQRHPINNIQVAFGIIRICISGVVGYLTLVVSLALSTVLLDIDWRK